MVIILKRINQFLVLHGIDLKKIYSLRFIAYYFYTCIQFLRIGGKIKFIFPVLSDRNDLAGSIKDHYFLQDIHVARKIYSHNPTRHIDIGSRIDGFIAHLAIFRKVEVFDIRNLPKKVDENITFKKVDINKVPAKYIKQYESVSCLHTIEHIGLGRYGDKINVNGHLDAIENIAKLVKMNGFLYLSVPISSKTQVYFNMHRVMHPNEIPTCNILKNKFSLISFDYIDDNGNLLTNVSIDEIEKLPTYGCGIYQFIRIRN